MNPKPEETPEETTFVARYPEAEKALIGSVMVSEEAAQYLVQLPKEVFYNPKNRAIHTACKQIVADNQQPDLVTLPPILEQAGQFTNNPRRYPGLVSTDYLLEIFDREFVAREFKTYGEILKRLAKQRKFIGLAKDLLGKANHRQLSKEEMKSLEEDLKRQVFELAVDDSAHKGLQPLANSLGPVLQELAAKNRGEIPACGIPTGFSKLDKDTTGLNKGELWIICARPSVGKSSLLLDIGINVSRSVPVYLFSLEMTKEELIKRLLSKGSGYHLKSVRTGQVRDFSRITSSAGDLSDLPFYIDDTPNMSPMHIRARIRAMSCKTGQSPSLILVDYLQLMKAGRRMDNREREIATISRELKGISKDFEVPVICACQLNRQLENRPNKRPLLADLRESGSIEQDADTVIALYKEHQYKPREADESKVEAIILKQRNGGVGMEFLRWHGPTTTFSDWTNGDESRPEDVDLDNP